ncbi:MAG: hypothetical protein WC661_20045 [Opitutaceae bacterium]|jgi:outer membrane protein assembly factor BamE (lipoprotein component of BamABCDE complex)
MKLRNVLILVFAAALLALTGCSTFESRSKQKAAAFSALDAATQARLKVGEIHLGDTMDEVYIALGHPDEKREITTEKEKTTAWIYSRYWQEYQGQAYAGARPVYTKNPTTGAVSVYYETVRQPVYANRSEERLRITFKDDKVTIIEKAK